MLVLNENVICCRVYLDHSHVVCHCVGGNRIGLCGLQIGLMKTPFVQISSMSKQSSAITDSLSDTLINTLILKSIAARGVKVSFMRSCANWDWLTGLAEDERRMKQIIDAIFFPISNSMRTRDIGSVLTHTLLEKGEKQDSYTYRMDEERDENP